jgi:isocitrate lyase
MDAEAGIFHPPNYPTYVSHDSTMNDLTQGYFGADGMLTYVRVQRQEIRKGVLLSITSV